MIYLLLSESHYSMQLNREVNHTKIAKKTKVIRQISKPITFMWSDVLLTFSVADYKQF